MSFSNPQKISSKCKVKKLYANSAVHLVDNNTELAEKIFRRYDIDCKDDGNIVVSCTCDSSRAMTYVEESRKLTDEKYIIDCVCENDNFNIHITYCSAHALYYALCDVCRMIKSGKITVGKTENYPLFGCRGYIEGFYGKPWSFDERIDMLRLMSEHRINTYYYAPKDDEYHRSKWDKLYPDDKLAELSKIVKASKENFVDFYFCIAPGLSICYSDESHFSALTQKLEQLYSVGIRNFGLLLDDIPERLIFKSDIERFGGETVNAHIYLINRLYDTLKKIDRAIELTACPLQYHGKGDEYFISKLGCGIEPDIKLFWTGRNICSQELTVNEALRFIENTRHKPLYWDNFPVNDAEMYNEMHLGYIDGRDAELYRYSDGLISNCMEFCECSKIPLLTVADYLWNPEKYDAKKSWAYAMETVVGSDSKSFGYFADNLLVSCLKSENSAIMGEALSETRTLINTGDFDNAAKRFSSYVAQIEKCCKLLKKRKGDKLYSELWRWAEKFLLCGEILKLCESALFDGDVDAVEKIKEKSDKYFGMPETLTDFCFRETVDYILNLSQERNV